MQISGITGQSAAYGHAGWMDVLSMDHGQLRSSTIGPAVQSDLHFLRKVDSATPLLYDRLNRGTVIPEVKIEFIRGTPPLVQFYQMTLTTVRLSSVQDSASAGSGDVFESVSLAFEQVAWSYTQVTVPGMPASTATWNQVTNRGSYSTNLVDTDLDGMPNDWELANGLNPNLFEPNADPDNDGLTNYQEFLAGTHPKNANSIFRVRRINLATGQVRVTWTSVTGKTYTISAASQVEGPYTPVRNVPSAGDGETFSDFPRTAAHQFYRVSTP